jgi:hypothetical protein
MPATHAEPPFQKVAIILQRSGVIADNVKIHKAGRLRFLQSLPSLHHPSMNPPRHLLKKIEPLRIMMIMNPNG